MSSPKQSASGMIRLVPVTAPEPWSAAVLPLSGFPAPQEELGPVRRFLEKLVKMAGENSACVETFIQLATLHLADGATHLSKNGRQWMPAMGLGVWPDREPPTGWTVEEMQQLVPGEQLRPLMNIALRVSGPVGARHQARDVLIGRGTIIQMFSNLQSDALLSGARDLLLPPIQDPSFTSFPYYIPLLEAKSVSGSKLQQLDAWCCGAHTYLRESVEDQGILIVSRSLNELLNRLGGALSEEETPEWRIPEKPYVSL
jgi:hypothetical protein